MPSEWKQLKLTTKLEGPRFINSPNAPNNNPANEYPDMRPILNKDNALRLLFR